LPNPLAPLPLTALDTVTIQQWYNSLPVSAYKRREIHARLCQVLDLAVEQKRIAENPARVCRVPPYVSQRGTALTVDQVRAFLAVATADPYHPFWHLALATGMRRGELLGLRWQDINFAHGLLTIRQTLVWTARSHRQNRAKNKSSLRSVYLGEESLTLLRIHQERQVCWKEIAGPDWEDTDAVFSTRQGNYLCPPDVVRAKMQLMERAGLPRTLRIHDLRHTAISHLLNHGAPVAAVAARGGYANANVLLSVYAHEDVSGQQQVALLADSLLGGGEGVHDGTGVSDRVPLGKDPPKGNTTTCTTSPGHTIRVQVMY
jgi:integrase